MRFEILQPSALLPEDAALPEAKRLSVLASEALGRTVRREVATWIKSRPGEPTVIFDWLDTGWAERTGADEKAIAAVAGGHSAGPKPGQRWIPVPDYSRDLGQAEHLLERALEAGYSLRRESEWCTGGNGRPTHLVRIWWMGNILRGRLEPPAGWRGASEASSAWAAEATTLAFLQLTGRISTPEEEPCPTPST